MQAPAASQLLESQYAEPGRIGILQSVQTADWRGHCPRNGRHL